MIENPNRYIKDYAKAGSDTIIIHHEASSDIIKDLSESYQALVRKNTTS